MAAIQVQVFLAVITPYTATLCLDGSDIKKGIYVEKIHDSKILECDGLESQTSLLVETEGKVHILHSLAGSALEQIVHH